MQDGAGGLASRHDNAGAGVRLPRKEQRVEREHFFVMNALRGSYY